MKAQSLTLTHYNVLAHLITSDVTGVNEPYVELNELSKIIYKQETIDSHSKEKYGITTIELITVGYLSKMAKKGLLKPSLQREIQEDGIPTYRIVGFRYTEEGKQRYLNYGK